ncbi:hypothetical protein SAMN05421676_10583 [Salinibacillus kushneri]|uniref:Thioredoxin n=1 Tax=Salinibacillus kushneri TaxID=237682 RepID=A0A1I0EW05_9BACI|nr:thioredoxin [Salinibacillus kushneri]SET49082.1 hypothetical protein SAMN05421676_10583 [Salinibacillus kushneri]
MAKTITSEEYQDLVKNMDKPMVLEFGANW